jgi:Fe2+ transport system protein FeoA
MNRQQDMPTTSLASLRHGDRALVVNIGTSDPKLGAKLAARGLVPGVEVGIVRGGDPLLLSIDDARWGMNRNDADLINVDIIERTRKSLLQRLWSR